MAGYTTIDDLDVSFLAVRYGLEEIGIVPLEGGAANSSFRLTAGGDAFVLTVLDNHDVAGAGQLAVRTQRFFALGVPTSEIILDRDGSAVPVMGGRPVLLKRWIEGDVVDPLPGGLLAAAGELLGRLHNLPVPPGVPAGTRRLSGEQMAVIPRFEEGFAAWLAEGFAEVGESRAGRRRSSVVCHGDLFADNLIRRPDGSLALIDWETVSVDDPLLDLGMAVVGLARVGGRLCSERLDLLVRGYTRVRRMFPEDLGELGAHVRLAALIIAFHRYYRHHVRFPDPAKAHLHRALTGFVDSIDAATAVLTA